MAGIADVTVKHDFSDLKRVLEELVNNPPAEHVRMPKSAIVEMEEKIHALSKENAALKAEIKGRNLRVERNA